MLFAFQLAGWGHLVLVLSLIAAFVRNRELGKVHMAEILKAHPDVNVIYTVNEPVALGALDALKEARANLRKIVLVSIDGGCAAIKTAVRRGEIDATAMQFPQNMARQGVKVLALNIREGTRPEGTSIPAFG